MCTPENRIAPAVHSGDSLLLVQCQFQPLQHPTRPSQCFCRFAATEDHKVVRVVYDSRPKLLRPPGLSPSLQHPVHIQICEQRTDHTSLWSAAIIVLSTR